LSWQGPANTFFIFCAMSALTFIFVLKQTPETKGRTLEENSKNPGSD
jgi:hypothetical protein